MFGHGRQPRRVPSPPPFGSTGTLRIVPNDAATYQRFLTAFGSKSLFQSLRAQAFACLLPLEILLRHGLLGSRLSAQRELSAGREVLNVVL